MQRQLLQSATSGNLAEVKKCIENNVPINHKFEPKGFTALHASVEAGHKQVVQLLVDSGADISITDNSGKTALHLAVEKLRADILSVLLQNTRFNKLFINIPDPNGNTALHIATQLRNKELITILIRGGAEVSANNKENNSPFKMADKEIKQVISDACSEDKNKIVGRLPGHKLTQEDKHSIFTYIENGETSYVKLNTPNNLLTTNRAGHTLLYVAVQAWQHDIVEYLLSKGAPVNEGCIEKSLKRSPLHYASFGCDLEMVRVLLDHGADANAYDFKENTPLHLAAEWKKTDIVGLLIDRGADPDMTDGDGLTAMHRAAMFNRKSVVAKLLEKGADPDCLDLNGRAPLHYAAQWGWHKVVTLLIKHPCYFEAVDNNSWTALHYACRWGRRRSAQLLIEAAPQLKNMRNSDAQSPYQLAKAFGRDEVLSLFPPPSAEKRPPVKPRKVEVDQEQAKSELSKAIKKGNNDKVQEIFQKYKLDKRTVYFALFAAVRASNADILSDILDANDKISLKDCIDEQGRSIVHVAVLSRSMEILSELLSDDEIPVNRKDLNGQTPLHSAILLPSFPIDSLKELIQRANIAVTDNNGNTPFHLLISKSSSGPDFLQKFKLLLKRAKSKNILGSKNNNGETPLHIAISQDNWSTEMAEYLISSGSPLEEVDNQKRTPLFIAAYHGKTKIAKFLIMAGASAVDTGAGDPMLVGGSSVQNAILEAIDDKNEIEKGQAKEANQQNNSQLFAEIFEKGDYDKAVQWLNNGGDVTAKDEDESVPLHIAAYNGHTEIVNLLLQYRSDPNAVDKNGQTPLHLAAMKGHLDIVKSLIESGSDVNALDLEDQTPIDWASLMGKSEVTAHIQQFL